MKNISKFRVLVEDYDIQAKEKRYFAVYHVIKRALQALGIVELYYVPVLQVLSTWIPNFTLMILLVLYKPHNRASQNLFNSMTEIGFVIIHSMILVLAHDDIQLRFSHITREYIGFAIIITCLFIVIVELGVIVHEQYQTFKSVYQTLRKKFCNVSPKKEGGLTQKISTRSKRNPGIRPKSNLITQRPNREGTTRRSGNRGNY